MRRATSDIRIFVTAILIAALIGPTAAFGNPALISQKQAEADRARAELNRLAVEVELAGEDLAEAEAELEATLAAIVENERAIEAAQMELDEAKERMRDRANATYRMGDASYLTVLLGSSGFTDFVTRLDFVQRIASQDVQAIRRVEAAQRLLVELEWSLSQREAEQRELQLQAQERRDAMASAASRQQSVINELDAEVAGLIAAERRRQAEEAARAAAEAAAKAAAEAARPRAQAATPNAPAQGDVVPQPGSSSGGGNATPPVGNPGAPRAGVIEAAQKYLGIPYVWGGTTMDGLDCSGFTMLVYREVGVKLPRTSREQFARYSGTFIPPDRLDLLQPGDLLFWARNNDPAQIHHVGLYAGGGSYVHAPQAGDEVRYSTLRVTSGYFGAVRP